MSRLDYVNYLFYIIFLSEMCIKIGGLGPRAYVRDYYNIFDAFIVSVSTIDVLVTAVQDAS